MVTPQGSVKPLPQEIQRSRQYWNNVTRKDKCFKTAKPPPRTNPLKFKVQKSHNSPKEQQNSTQAFLKRKTAETKAKEIIF